MKILFISLGCDKNLVDTEMMLGTLVQKGYSITDDETQADIIGAPVERPGCVETTAMGAAYLAGLAVGYWKNTEEILKNWTIDRSFEPLIEEQVRLEKAAGWSKAVKYSYGWAK